MPDAPSTTTTSHRDGSKTATGERTESHRYAPAHPSHLWEAHSPPQTSHAQRVPGYSDSVEDGKQSSFATQHDGHDGIIQDRDAVEHRHKDNVDPYSWDQPSIASAVAENVPPPFAYPATNEGLGADSLEGSRTMPIGLIGNCLERIGVKFSLRTSKWLAQRHNIRHPWMM